MWAMTLLSLYGCVQVTILGRHLYLDFARGTDGAQLQVNFCWSDPPICKLGLFSLFLLWYYIWYYKLCSDVEKSHFCVG
jgi:hypothetical protein